jgi:hypothetical protein
MFALYQKDERTERERYLEEEVERYQAQVRAQMDREIEKGKKRREGLQRQFRKMEREAETWPEAFDKQVMLLQRERNFEASNGDPNEKDVQVDWWDKQIKLVERAKELWAEAERKRAKRVERLERRLLLLRDCREEVALRLVNEFGNNNLTRELRKTERPSDLLDW